MQDDGDGLAVAVDGRGELGDADLDPFDAGEFRAKRPDDAAGDVLDEAGTLLHLLGHDAVDVAVIHRQGQIVRLRAGTEVRFDADVDLVVLPDARLFLHAAVIGVESKALDFNSL